jgi:hypothetical protein
LRQRHLLRSRLVDELRRDAVAGGAPAILFGQSARGCAALRAEVGIAHQCAHQAAE